MTVMKPRAGAGKSARLLLVLVTVALGASMLAFLSVGEISPEMLLEMALVALIVAAVGAVLVLESRRARSVELTTEGVTALVWRRWGGIFPFRLETLAMPWTAVEAISQRGYAVGLMGRGCEIVVNTYLFENPEATLAFINERVAAATRQ